MGIMALLAMVGSLHAQSTEERLALDFNKTHDEVKQYIQRYIPDVTEAQIDHWEKTKALETCYINGKKWYFHNAAPNLFRIDPQCRAIKLQKDGEQKSAYMEDERNDIPAIMKAAPHSLRTRAPIRLRSSLTWYRPGRPSAAGFLSPAPMSSDRPMYAC